MPRTWPIAALIALVAPSAVAGDAYQLTVAPPVARSDWQTEAPAALRECGGPLPAAPAARAGAVRVINIVKDRYFVKFFDGGRLPRMITQQQDVPRAIVIDSGSWRLPELARAVNDPKALSADHVLGLPLLIRPGAALVVEKGAWLRLDRARGAFILNLGEFQLRDARLSSWDAAARTPARLRGATDFRPYLLGWGGSRTVIDHSLLESLGFSEHLSGGLGFAAGPFGLKGIDGGRAPEAWVTRNRINDAWNAVRVSDAPARLCGNVVDGTHAHGLQVEGGKGVAYIARNRVTRVRNGNAVTVSGSTGAWISGNDISDNAQSGLVLTGAGNAWVTGNTLRRNGSDGIRLQGSSARLLDNVSSSNGDHGVQVRNGSSVRLQGLEAEGNGGAGIELTRQVDLRLPADTRWHVVLSDSQLLENRGGAIGMDGPYTMIAGALVITDSGSLRRPLLRWSLNAVEAPFLKQVLVDRRFVRVEPRAAAVTGK